MSRHPGARDRAPRWIKARYPGICHKCNEPIERGALVFYYPSTHALFCSGDCGDAAAADFGACCFDESVYNREGD